MGYKQILIAFIVLGVVEGTGLLTYTLWAEVHHERVIVEAQPEPTLPVHLADQSEIDQRIRSLFGADGGLYSVYFLRPADEQQAYLFNSHPVQAASMIKLFIFAKAMQDIHDGRLSNATQVPIDAGNIVGGAGVLNIYHEGETRSIGNLINLMITDSDNTATNILIDQLGGMGEINRYIQQHGYKDTILQHKMMVSNGGLSNLTSVKDVGTLLYRIYRRQCVDEATDGLMEDIMQGQKDRECFPTALPDWKIAHKTGEITGAYHDGGILRQGDETVIIVVMSNGWKDRAGAMLRLREASQYLADQTKTARE